MDISQLLFQLGRVAAWDKAADWDPVGLQLGTPGDPVGRVAVCHEVTEAVVSRVEEDPVDLLITYHPLLFRPAVRLVAGRSPAGRAYRLIRANVALAVVHTNFDVAPGGVSDSLAAAVGLVDTSGFGPVDAADMVKVVTFAPEAVSDLVANAMAGAGGGIIGNYSHCSYRGEGYGIFFAGAGTEPAAGEAGGMNREPETRIEMTVPAAGRDAVLRALIMAHPYEEPAFDVYPVAANLGMVGRVGSPVEPVDLQTLAGRVAGTLGGDGFRVTGNPDRPVGRVAVVPGSGSSYIRAAAAAGADTLITGDVGHHRVVEADDLGVAVIDPGHLATERPGIRKLYSLVAGIVPETADLTIDAEAIR